jgi:hypothetical protein
MVSSSALVVISKLGGLPRLTPFEVTIGAFRAFLKW